MVDENNYLENFCELSQLNYCSRLVPNFLFYFVLCAY